MRRDEVLQNRQAFPEIGLDGCFDNFTGRLGHEATHASQLTHLILAAARAGIRHHENGIESGRLVTAGRWRVLHGFHHFIGHVVGRLGPYVDNLVVLFTLGDQPFGVLASNLRHLFFGLFQNIPFLFRDNHGVYGNRQPALSGITVADVLESVGQNDRCFGAQPAIDQVHQLPEGLLVHDVIHGLEGNPHLPSHRFKKMKPFVGFHRPGITADLEVKERFGILLREVIDAPQFALFQETREAVVKDERRLVVLFHDVFEGCAGLECLGNRGRAFFRCHHDVVKRHDDVVGHNFVEQNPSHRGFLPFSADPQEDLRMQLNRSGIVGNPDFVRAAEDAAVSLAVFDAARHVVDAQDDILARDNDRAAVGR